MQGKSFALLSAQNSAKPWSTAWHSVTFQLMCTQRLAHSGFLQGRNISTQYVPLLAATGESSLRPLGFSGACLVFPRRPGPSGLAKGTVEGHLAGVRRAQACACALLLVYLLFVYLWTIEPSGLRFLPCRG